MAIAVPLIFFGVFVASCFALFLFFTLGIKKKSFEEAKVEHQKQASALLGPKPKLKEKKNKKAAKKINKEKKISDSNPENETTDESEGAVVEAPAISEKPEKKISQPGKNAQKGKSSPKQIRVEFNEKTVEIKVDTPVEKEVKEVLNKKEEPAKTEQVKEEKRPEKSSKKNKQPKQEIVEKNAPVPEPPAQKEKPKEEKVLTAVALPAREPVTNSGKEKKKKKSEFNTKQQLTAERDQLIYALRKAELSRTEVQLLIDLLLNKQLEAPAVIDEWSEGKSDPVQKLKKQLAEKEKLLADEQEFLAGVQAKLKEVRSEQQADRSQFQQKLRIVEQKLQEVNDARNKEISQMKQLMEENSTLKMHGERALLTYKEIENVNHSLKTDNANLTSEIQRLQQDIQVQGATYQKCLGQILQLQEELRQVKEYAESHQTYSRTMAEEKRVIAENALEEEKRLREAIEQLQMENARLQEEKNMQVNGSAESNKAHEVKLLNITNELSSVKTELTTINQKFQDAERNYQTNLEVTNDTCSSLRQELEEQKIKNNELRQKNWKVMEALNAAESRSKSAATKEPEVDIDKLSADIRIKEQDAQKEFLQRLFPKLDDLKTVSSQDWYSEYERLIQDHIATLENKPPVTIPNPDQTEEISKLKGEVLKYKAIIDEADGSLRNLQSSIEQAERTWRNQLAEKDSEIQELKTKQVPQINACQHISSPDVNGIKFAYTCIEKSLPGIIEELQNRVTSLEHQLEDERIEKQRLLEERQQIIDRPEPKSIHADSTATIEKLSEEMYRLKEQLRVEQTKNGDANVYQNGKTS